MQTSARAPLDYLTVGHVTKDLAADGYTLGGTASYSSLTARAFGQRVGVLTAFGEDITVAALDEIEIARKPSACTTTFENIETVSGRKQYLHQIADPLKTGNVPESLKSARILHLGPVADEVDAEIASLFPGALIGLTPQGWMRKRGNDGLVGYQEWNPPRFLIDSTDAVVISVEDVHGNEDLIAEYAHQFKVLAVTEGYNGARVYWHGDVRRFRAPKMEVVDPTGAGDIFAAAFFIRLKATLDPWKAAAFAVNLASLSVTRKGLLGVPRPEEVQSNLVEIIRGSSLS
ncbi:MAG: PfkB family carbohydrate kinase [Pelolinea sp.]|nr:PfkB family carbohydrate kinase [Pelolinea sp.]